MGRHFLRSAGSPRIFKTLISVACFCFWVSLAMASENPRAVIKHGTDQVFKILNENPENTYARREEIRAVLNEFFDFEGIARCVLGPQWDNQPPEKQQEFTQDLSKLLINTIGEIRNYANGNITYNQKQMGQDNAVVEAVLSQNWAGRVGIDYYLYLKTGTGRYTMSLSREEVWLAITAASSPKYYRETHLMIY